MPKISERNQINPFTAALISAVKNQKTQDN